MAANDSADSGGAGGATDATSGAQTIVTSGGTIYVVSHAHGMQAQSVIQPNQSVIQSVQLMSADQHDESSEESDVARKRREVLARRPSYRKILNDLVEEDDSDDSRDKAGSQSPPHTKQELMALPPGMTVVPASALQLAASGDGIQGLQTLTMTNTSSANQIQTPITVHYAQTQDGQVFQIPAGAATAIQLTQGADGQVILPADLQGYQMIRTNSSLGGQGVVVTSGAIQSPHQLAEEATRKRELRLMKNKEAARECRRKKKEYVKCLENRVAVLESQNKQLIDELKQLKELYCQKD